MPVNYALLDDEVVFRTDPGTKLSAALMRTMVAFEVFSEHDLEALFSIGD